jgi:hypothetical protein
VGLLAHQQLSGIGCHQEIFQEAAKLESGHKLKVFRTDRGGEFTSNELDSFFADQGVK